MNRLNSIIREIEEDYIRARCRQVLTEGEYIKYIVGNYKYISDEVIILTEYELENVKKSYKLVKKYM